VSRVCGPAQPHGSSAGASRPKTLAAWSLDPALPNQTLNADPIAVLDDEAATGAFVATRSYSRGSRAIHLPFVLSPHDVLLASDNVQATPVAPLLPEVSCPKEV
jgi:hypothetical protein